MNPPPLPHLPLFPAPLTVQLVNDTTMPVFGFSVLLIVTGILWFHRYTGLTREKGLLCLSGAVLAGLLWVMYELSGIESPRHPFAVPNAWVPMMARSAAIVLLTGLVLRLWNRWVMEGETAEERQPGLPGVRAWFSSANVAVGLLLVVTLWLAFRISPLASVILLAAVLAAPALIRLERSHPSPVSSAADNSPAESEKILTMLESGRITADECSDLLQALRQPEQAATVPVPLTSSQRMMLIGAAIVALGFFFPWYQINPAKEVPRMMRGMAQPIDFSVPVASFPGFRGNDEFGGLRTPEIAIPGGDIQGGLGWLVLATALTATLLPYFTTRLDAATARTVRLTCAGAGLFILVYLIIQRPSSIGSGLVMALAGQAVLAIGLLRGQREPR